MGQYHYIVNLDKLEYIDPLRLGIGLKAWEQIANNPSTPQALFALLICSNDRGGGDLHGSHEGPDRVLGRWAGDRIAVVGDYAEDGDLPAPLPHRPSKIFGACDDGHYREVSDLVRPVLSLPSLVSNIMELLVAGKHGALQRLPGRYSTGDPTLSRPRRSSPGPLFFSRAINRQDRSRCSAQPGGSLQIASPMHAAIFPYSARIEAIEASIQLSRSRRARSIS